MRNQLRNGLVLMGKGLMGKGLVLMVKSLMGKGRDPYNII